MEYDLHSDTRYFKACLLILFQFLSCMHYQSALVEDWIMLSHMQWHLLIGFLSVVRAELLVNRVSFVVCYPLLGAGLGSECNEYTPLWVHN